MNKLNFKLLSVLLLQSIILISCTVENEKNVTVGHKFNGNYTGEFLDRVSFPIGGIGAGMFCMDGTGSISHMSVNNKPEVFNEPFMFAAINVKGFEN
jgi:hypothetical protein